MKNIVILLTALFLSANCFAKEENKDTIPTTYQYLKGSEFWEELFANKFHCENRKDHVKKITNVRGDEYLKDSTVLFFDKEGRITKHISIEKGKKKSNKSKSTISYSVNKKTNEIILKVKEGKRKGIIAYNKDGYMTKMGFKNDTLYFEYLPDNRLTKVEDRQIKITSDYLSNGEIVVKQYNREGHLISKSIYDKHGFSYYSVSYTDKDSTIDDEIEKNIYTYYPSGKVKSRSDSKSKILYNEDGDIILEQDFDDKGNIELQKKYTYNEDGQVVEYTLQEKIERYDGEKIAEVINREHTEKTEYINSIISKKTIINKASDNDEPSEEIITYDSHGNELRSNKGKWYYKYEYYE